MSLLVWITLSGLLGAAVGSLVYLVADRMPRDVPLLVKPLSCPHCGQPWPALARIPILGAIVAGGRCPACRVPSLRRKGTIELATAASFVLVGWRFFPDPVMTAVFCWYATLFAAIFVIDLEHRLILNRMIFPALVTAPATAFMTGLSLPSSLLGGAMGLGLLGGMYLLGNVLFGAQRGALGMGDVKLGLYLGLITGMGQILAAIFAFSLLAGVVSALLLVTGVKGRRDHIPFGPFMVLGTAAVLLKPW